jgi:hypothetical protein
MLSAAWPSAQIQSKIASIASGVVPAAMHSRNAARGLNGCAGGKRNGRPSCRARHHTWR